MEYITPTDKEEIEKCLKSPYYFATKYLTITDTDGVKRPFTTNLSEQEFNYFCSRMTTNTKIQ